MKIDKKYKQLKNKEKMTMRKVKMIIEIVKFIGIIASLLDGFERIEAFIKKRNKPKPNPVGLKIEE